MIAFVANTIGFLVSSTFFLFTGSAVFSFAAVGGGVPLENKENKENKEENKEEKINITKLTKQSRTTF